MRRLLDMRNAFFLPLMKPDNNFTRESFNGIKGKAQNSSKSAPHQSRSNQLQLPSRALIENASEN